MTSCWEHALEWDVPKKVVQIKKIDSETTSYRIRFWYKGPFGGGVVLFFSPVPLLPTYPRTPATKTAVPLSNMTVNLPGVNGVQEDLKTKDP